MKIVWLFVLVVLLSVVTPSVSAYYPGYYSAVEYNYYSFSFPHYNYYSPYYVDRGFDYFGRSNLQWSFDDRASMGERLFTQSNYGYRYGNSYYNPAPSFFN